MYTIFVSLVLIRITNNKFKLVDIKKVAQSVENELGESDVVIYAETEIGKIQIHIEDKVDADAQPEQYARYVKRCDREIRDGNAKECFICLVAPQNYILKEKQDYPVKISFNEILEMLNNANADEIDKVIVKMCIEKQNNHASVKVVNETKTNFWNEYYNFVEENYYSSLVGRYVRTRDKGNESVWHRFKGTGVEGVQIVIKYNKCCVDIQFSEMGSRLNEINAKFKHLFPSNVSLNQRKKGAAITFSIPSVDLSSDFNSQIENIRIALDTTVSAFELLESMKNEGLKESPF